MGRGESASEQARRGCWWSKENVAEVVATDGVAMEGEAMDKREMEG